MMKELRDVELQIKFNKMYVNVVKSDIDILRWIV